MFNHKIGEVCISGCGSVQGMYGNYIFVKALVSRTQAQDACATLGMHLINIQTVQKYEEVVKFLGQFNYNDGNPGIWTGGYLKNYNEWSSDLSAWTWSDSTSMFQCNMPNVCHVTIIQYFQ